MDLAVAGYGNGAAFRQGGNNDEGPNLEAELGGKERKEGEGPGRTSIGPCCWDLHVGVC